ncbi:hypothetical protein M2405_004263 [Rhodococcus erythropolis]|uniref:hypothetical protein n=1 Tax=Rhodococcus TaxID=1827 RepID=UPI0009C2629D|nr:MULTISPECIES: hypothetical protein [Rhodococcus]ARE38160.1 hypothetical protein A0W34_32360 [Rhodococcus sp. BH4]MCS4255960.1 hypothetical protein [Rhodococcus erythropolis]MCW2425477.1 hypothetical protein [Rhodococcus erythropolis]
MAVLVNIRRSGASTADATEIMEAASGDWVLSESALDEFGDVVFAILHNRVVGAFDLLSWEEVEGRRFRFELRPSEDYAAFVGQDSPRPWKKGQANPVAFWELADLADGPKADENPAPKPRRGVHRITIETKGLSDAEAARLHHALIIVAQSSGALHDYRTTSLVREMKKAQEDAQFSYRSAASPRAQKD